MQNEVIDSLKLITQHLNDLKSAEFEKFINLLIKIKYTNFDTWKKVLTQYIMYISLLSTSYQPLREKDIVQILHYLKNMYTFLPYNTSKDVQNLLERAIKESIIYLVNNLDKMTPELISSIINSISKLGYLDENNCRKIEETITPVFENMSHKHFTNILFCICRNRCASENFMKNLEKYSEKILDEHLETGEFDKFSVTMIAKCIIFKNLKLFSFLLWL